MEVVGRAHDMAVITQNGITKKQSALLQGVAILLMIYHHFFNDPSLYGDALVFRNEYLVRSFAWFGKICVGLFAFVSGYGLCKILDKWRDTSPVQKGFLREIGEVYLLCLKQIAGLWIRYWSILVPGLAILVTLGKRSFTIGEFVGNFFCYRPTYNGAFWYVEQYTKMLLILPIADGLLHKNKTSEKSRTFFYGVLLALGGMALIGILALPAFRTIAVQIIKAFRPAFLAAFLVGYLSAGFGVFEWLFQLFSELKGSFRWLLGVLLICLAGGLRIYLADSAAYARFDFLIVPLFSLGLLLAVSERGMLGKGLQWLGKRSVYLWLTHILVFELSKDLLLKLTQSHILFYLMELLLCILIGEICFWIEGIVTGKRMRQKK